MFCFYFEQLEKEIESLQSKFSELVERREREGEESRNLEVMLRTDLERVHSERYAQLSAPH